MCLSAEEGELDLGEASKSLDSSLIRDVHAGKGLRFGPELARFALFILFRVRQALVRGIYQEASCLAMPSATVTRVRSTVQFITKSTDGGCTCNPIFRIVIA
jgi:hypothetical protein